MLLLDRAQVPFQFLARRVSRSVLEMFDNNAVLTALTESVSSSGSVEIGKWSWER